MAVWTVTDPQGRELELEGENPPTEADLTAIFGKAFPTEPATEAPREPRRAAIPFYGLQTPTAERYEALAKPSSLTQPALAIPSLPPVDLTPPNPFERAVLRSTLPGLAVKGILGEDRAVQAGRSLANQGVGLLNFMQSPLGVATIPLAEIAPAAVAGGYALDMLNSLRKQIPETWAKWPELSRTEKVDALVNIGAPAILAGMLGKKAVGGAINKVIEFADKRAAKGAPEAPVPPAQAEPGAPVKPTAPAESVATGEGAPTPPPAPAITATTAKIAESQQEVSDASRLREDQGKLPEAGKVAETSEEARGNDVEQPTPGEPGRPVVSPAPEAKKGEILLRPKEEVAATAAPSGWKGGEYAYHATSKANAAKVRSEGIKPGSWFAKTPEEAKAFAKSEGAVVFAVKASELKPTGAAPGDIFGQEFAKAGVFVRSSETHIPSHEAYKEGEKYILKPTPPPEAGAGKGAKRTIVDVAAMADGRLITRTDPSAAKLHGLLPIPKTAKRVEMGFLDDQGKFVTRKQASELTGATEATELLEPQLWKRYLNDEAEGARLQLNQGKVSVDIAGIERLPTATYEYALLPTGTGRYVVVFRNAGNEGGWKGMTSALPSRAAAETWLKTNIRPEQPPAAPKAGQVGEVPPVLPPGPGAATAGAPPYSAISQLNDQLKTVAGTMPRESIPLKERLADKWAQGKTLLERGMAGMRVVSRGIQDMARGVREYKDLDAKVGELDFALQQSVAKSREGGKLMEKQYPNRILREASFLRLESDAADIQAALANLPEKTSPHIRRVLVLAAKLPNEGDALRGFLEQFYSVRLQDAMDTDILNHGLADYATHIWKSENNMPDSLRAAMSNGKVNTYFQFGKKRVIASFLEGIMHGKEPVLDPAKIIPYYNHALDRAIASRQFIKDASELKEADGRPTLGVAGTREVVPRGETPEALLIRPQGTPEVFADYETVNHPALRKWKWAGKDENGNPIFYQGELKVHPDAYERIARMMDRGRLTPSPLGRAALRIGGEWKAFKFGLFSAFHQVHTSSHAMWHWTDPIKASRTPIDWDAPETKFAVEKGHLKLAPDSRELNTFAEGILSPGLVHKVPLIGPWSRAYQQSLFLDIIPRLKLRTFNNAMARARSRWTSTGRALRDGRMTEDQVAARIGDSVNNAFGELNRLWLGKYGRQPWFQRALQMIFFAPDFGEARLRFVEKALTRYGTEERLALATMFLTMYTLARFGNWASHGDAEWDWRNAFAVKVGDHWWSMRSVVGDIDHMLANFGQFMFVRLNPLYMQRTIELLTGKNARGLKVGPSEQLKDLALSLVPIQGSGFTRDDQKLWEGFVGSMGASARRETPEQNVFRLIREWKETSTDPKIKAQAERAKQETFAPSDYRNLQVALRFQNYPKAQAEYEKLLETKSASTIKDYFNPKDSKGNWKPFSRSPDVEKRFKAELDDRQMDVYRAAQQERLETFRRFNSMYLQ